MAKQKKIGNGQYVRKETLWLVSLLALAVGFFSGVVFAVYKSEPGIPGNSPPPRATSSDRAGMIAALENETQRNPQNVEAWTQLGNSYFDNNEYEKSIQAYKKSLELNPKNADVWTDMGVMYRRNGQSEEALKAFEQAMAVDPKHEVSRLNKGIVLLHDLKDTKGAIQAWEELLEVNPLAMAPGGKSIDQLIQQLKKQTSP
ncbi:MAG: tetratricopeptide repeat protein [Desulfobacterales bacterium]|nr:MAG: tetratricopeptide repeat protein [Desulfobacterales bacterium]